MLDIAHSPTWASSESGSWKQQTGSSMAPQSLQVPLLAQTFRSKLPRRCVQLSDGAPMDSERAGSHLGSQEWRHSVSLHILLLAQSQILVA